MKTIRLAGVLMLLALLIPSPALAVPWAQSFQVAPSGPCLPPGVPAFRDWHLMTARPAVLQDETGRPRLGVLAVYQSAGRQLTTFFLGSVLVSLDAAPQDASEPSWFDRGAVREDLTLRAEPQQACDWFRPVAKPKPDKSTRQWH